MTFRTVEWMQERLHMQTQRLHTLNDEIDCLKYEAEKAAEKERAKIVGHIRKVADRIENDPDGKVWGHLQAMAVVIEAGEHLK